MSCSQDYLYRAAIDWACRHTWLNDDIKKGLVKTDEKSIEKYFSGTIGECYEGGTFEANENNKMKCIGFFQCDRKGIKINPDSGEEVFFKWSKLAGEISDRLNNREQLSFF